MSFTERQRQGARSVLKYTQAGSPARKIARLQAHMILGLSSEQFDTLLAEVAAEGASPEAVVGAESEAAAAEPAPAPAPEAEAEAEPKPKRSRKKKSE